MYPQYGGRFCQVIDNYDPRAEQLIDDFKGEGTNDDLTIAVSVDMLDTGIDIPEILNLVFAKPVKSPVKFWQMIGRGTRLCKDLLGPGEHKSIFRIFDHWKNFERFEMGYRASKAGARQVADATRFRREIKTRGNRTSAERNPSVRRGNQTCRLGTLQHCLKNRSPFERNGRKSARFRPLQL